MVRLHARGSPAESRLRSMRRRPTVGRPAVTRWMLVRPQPSQLIPRSSNGRIFGSEPKDAWFESRPRSSYGRGHGGQSGSNPAGEGSIPSVRAPCPGLPADRGCRPLKPATRVRIPLGALTRPWCQRQHAGVPCLRCGFNPRRPLQLLLLHGALVLTGNTRGLHPWVRGSRSLGAPFCSLAGAQRSTERGLHPASAEVRVLPARLDLPAQSQLRSRWIRERALLLKASDFGGRGPSLCIRRPTTTGERGTAPV